MKSIANVIMNLEEIVVLTRRVGSHAEIIFFCPQCGSETQNYLDGYIG